MNDKKQIEEMARVICGFACDYENCEICPFNSINIPCEYHDYAIILINANYRKIPENAVMIPEKITEETSPSDILKIAKYNEKIRKETAREIIELLVPPCEICDEEWHKGCLCLRAKIAEKIAKQYGVEIKE